MHNSFSRITSITQIPPIFNYTLIKIHISIKLSADYFDIKGNESCDTKCQAPGISSHDTAQIFGSSNVKNINERKG